MCKGYERTLSGGPLAPPMRISALQHKFHNSSINFRIRITGHELRVNINKHLRVALAECSFNSLLSDLKKNTSTEHGC